MKEIDIVTEPRKTIIVYQDTYWTSMDTPDWFDILMKAHASVEITDLVGIYFL